MSHTDGKDDDGNGSGLRSVLAAAALRHRPRRPRPRRLEIRAHPAGVDRLSLAGDEQLLLEPDRLLLDQGHAARRLQLRAGHVVSVRATCRRRRAEHLPRTPGGLPVHDATSQRSTGRRRVSVAAVLLPPHATCDQRALRRPVQQRRRTGPTASADTFGVGPLLRAADFTGGAVRDSVLLTYRLG